MRIRWWWVALALIPAATGVASVLFGAGHCNRRPVVRRLGLGRNTALLRRRATERNSR